VTSLPILQKWILLRAVVFWLIHLPAGFKGVLLWGYTPHVITSSSKLFSLLMCLKQASSFRFKLLFEIISVDFPGKVVRFLLTCCFLSIVFNNRVWTSVFLDETKPLLSITPIFCSAIWLEREVYDMMGIFFVNHPDLRRILTDYGFRGAPLRKDFPLFGFVELSFNNQETMVRVQRQQADQNIRFKPQEGEWIVTS